MEYRPLDGTSPEENPGYRPGKSTLGRSPMVAFTARRWIYTITQSVTKY